ncbi:MAG: phage minor head protein [Bradymonadaceae bacterium]
MPREILLDPVTHPDSLEQKYAYKIEKQELDPLKKSLERYVLSALETMRSEINERAEQDSWLQYHADSLDDNLRVLERRFDKAIVEYEGQRSEAEMHRLAEQMAADVDEYNARNNEKHFSQLLGVNPTWNSAPIKKALDEFADENVDLITKMPFDVAQRIKTDVAKALKEGRRFEEIIPNVREKLGVGAYRGELIARDQIGKINGQLNQIRQQQMGVEGYVWVTMNDERVRPSHSIKDGEEFLWGKPPADTGHPGEDIQCRCHARGKVEDVISGLERGDARRRDADENKLPDPELLDFSSMDPEQLLDWVEQMRGTVSHLRRGEDDPFGPDDDERAHAILERARRELRSRESLQPYDSPPPLPDNPSATKLEHEANAFASAGEIDRPLYVSTDSPEDVVSDGVSTSRHETWNAEVVTLSTDKRAAEATGTAVEVRAQIRRPLEVDAEFWAGESEQAEHRRVYNALDKNPRRAKVPELVDGIRRAGFDAFIAHRPDGEPGHMWVFDSRRVTVVQA